MSIGSVNTPFASLNFGPRGLRTSRDILGAVKEGQATLERGTGPGADMRGWLDLPTRQTDDEISQLEETAAEIRGTDGLVVVGIGGSYLGARAAIEALRSPFDDHFPIHFAGHQLCADYHAGLLRSLASKRYCVNAISKSGTTTEPGIALRLLLDDLTRRFGAEELPRLVTATTDAESGTLRALAEAAGMRRFVVPDDVGGRFSVLTPVGLLPIAVAGYDIRALLRGAARMQDIIRDPARANVEDNPAMAYAAFRLDSYSLGKKIEVMATYTPQLSGLAAWWKQLFGESEGKDGRGIFPAAVDLTSDLHSLGQWLQDGERTVFETVLRVGDAAALPIPDAPRGEDGLEHLDGRTMDQVNDAVLQAALEAHRAGGVPCLRLEIPRLDEEHLGALLFLFEYSCGISAYALGGNPFDQPGVEAYKANLKRLLEHPGR